MFLSLSARLAGVALLAVVAALSLSACSGGGDETSADAYADDVCASVSEWVADVRASANTLREAGLSTTRADLTAAIDDVESSTQNLVAELERLGTPDTEDGAQAQEELQRFGNELTQQVEMVQDAVASGASVASIATTVSAAVTRVLTEAQATYQELQGLDPGGELQEAFEDSEDCDALREELDRARSS